MNPLPLRSLVPRPRPRCAALSAVGLILGVLLCAPVVAPGAPDCRVALGRAGIGVARATAREGESCLRYLDADRPEAHADFSRCLQMDGRGRIERAEDDVRQAESEHCAPLGATATAVSAAALDEQVGLLQALLGDLTEVPAVASRRGAKCRRSLLRSSGRLLAGRANQFLRCQRAALRSGRIDSPAALEACLDEATVDSSARVAALFGALARVVDGACAGVPVETVLGGTCKALPLAGCLEEQTACRACSMVARFNGVDLPCDLFDDGESNESCLPATRCDALPELCGWRFDDVTAAAGLNGAHAWDELAFDGSERERAIISGGVAAGDFDGDGWTDLYTVGGPDGVDRLLRNGGAGVFEDVTLGSGIARAGTFGSGPTFADYDGDGRLDLLIGGVNGTPIGLYRNLGNGAFAAQASTIVSPGPTFGAAFGDYDRDGDLDVCLANWTTPVGDSARLWRNEGAGIFVDVTEAAEVDSYRGAFPFDLSFTPNFADINSDGWPDLLIAADFGGSQVFLNDGDGTFTETTTAVISDENGMGAAVGDYDGDGDLDWFVTSITDPDGVAEGNWGLSGNRLYRNDGAGVFEDVTDAAGVREGYWGWGACMADFDLDGHLDLFHVNGFSTDSAGDFLQDPSRLFLSRGDGSFREVSAAVGLDDDGQGRGVVCFDYDRDGDIDVFVANNDQLPRLWRNGAETLERHFLQVRLAQAGPNSQAVGARVHVTTGTDTQMRELSAGSNFASQNPTVAAFGLGNASFVDTLRVEWPDGRESVLEDVAADQFLVLSPP